MKNEDKWIQDIRNRMEDYSEPLPAGMWEQLESELDTPKVIPMWRKWQAAAAAVLVLAVSSLTLWFWSSPEADKLSKESRIAQQQIAVLSDSGTNVVIPCFPWSDKLKWTIKEFGPLPVPAKGQVVKMNSLSYTLYRQLINWEQKQLSRMNEAGEVLLGDSVVREYCFQENYYFMAGDNAYNSQDSRYWGMLPESFIVGRAVRVWKSVNPDTDEIRWNRILRKIK